MPRGNAAFKQDLKAFVNRAQGNAEIVIRKIALSVLAALVRKSPVDTGRFRGNWFVQEDVSSQQTDGTDKGGGGTIEVGAVKIASFKVGEKLYILNHLPYSIDLEYGGSQQAPNGMVRITVAEFEQYLAAATSGLKT